MILLITACTPQALPKSTEGTDTPDVTALREQYKQEAAAANKQEYCKEKYQDNERKLSNAQNDLTEHQLDLTDAQEAIQNPRKQKRTLDWYERDVQNIQGQITADKNDIAEAEQWAKDIEKECEGVDFHSTADQ